MLYTEQPYEDPREARETRGVANFLHDTAEKEVFSVALSVSPGAKRCVVH